MATISAHEGFPGCGCSIERRAFDPETVHENGFTGYQCSDCRLIYIAPRPSPESIANLYFHDKAHVRAASHIRTVLGRKLHARMTVRIIHRHKQGGRLLEIGSGGGALLVAASRFFEVAGVDFNPVQVAHIRDHLGLRCERGRYQDAFAGQKFDIIYHCDVLSHLYDPIQEFRNMREMLNPGGIIVFETGNFGDLDPEQRSAITVFQYPDHIYFFSEKSLATLFGRCLLKVVERVHFDRTRSDAFAKLLQTTANPFRAPIPASSSTSTPAPASNSHRRSFKTIIRDWLSVPEFFLCYLLGRNRRALTNRTQIFVLAAI